MSHKILWDGEESFT